MINQRTLVYKRAEDKSCDWMEGVWQKENAFLHWNMLISHWPVTNVIKTLSFFLRFMTNLCLLLSYLPMNFNSLYYIDNMTRKSINHRSHGTQRKRGKAQTNKDTYSSKNKELHALKCFFGPPPPPMGLNYQNCFSPICSYLFIRTISKV